MNVTLEKPNQPDILALIAELDAYQDTLYPAEARYALDIDSLMGENVLFAVARDGDGNAIGCGAMVLYETYGEVKRMYVRREARGMGAAQAIIRLLESTALEKGCHTFLHAGNGTLPT